MEFYDFHSFRDSNMEFNYFQYFFDSLFDIIFFFLKYFYSQLKFYGFHDFHDSLLDL